MEYPSLFNVDCGDEATTIIRSIPDRRKVGMTTRVRYCFGGAKSRIKTAKGLWQLYKAARFFSFKIGTGDSYIRLRGFITKVLIRRNSRGKPTTLLLDFLTPAPLPDTYLRDLRPTQDH